MPRKQQQQPWPDGFDRSTYAKVVRSAIVGAADKARAAADTGTTSEVPALREWARRLGTVEALWVDEGGPVADSATEMVELALDATIVADANAPEGMHRQLDGGLVARWVELLDQLDPKWRKRKPRTALDLARRICVDWTVPENPDRNRSARHASELDTAAAQVMFAVTDGEGVEDPTEAVEAARIELDDLDLDVAWSARRVDRWERTLRRPRAPGDTPSNKPPPPKKTVGERVANAAEKAVFVTAGAAATATILSENVVQTANAFDRAMSAVASSLDAAFSSAGVVLARAVESIRDDQRRGRR